MVRLTRPKTVKPREQYRWSLEIAAVDGGLLEVADEFMYRAPDTGYVPVVKIEMDPAEAAWTSVLKKAFYLKSRGGKTYAAIQMTIRPNYAESGAIQIESILNTNNSTNLQP